MERKYYLPDEPIIFVTFPFDIVPGSSPIMIPWFAGGWGFGGGGRGLSFGGFGAPKFGAFEGICTTLSNNVWIDWIKLENYKRLILNNYKSPVVHNEQYLLWHLSLHLCLRRVLELLLNMLMWWTYWDYIGNILVPCWNRLHFADLLRCFRNADISNIFIHDLWNILFSHNLASCNIKVNQILIKIIIYRLCQIQLVYYIEYYSAIFPTLVVQFLIQKVWIKNVSQHWGKAFMASSRNLDSFVFMEESMSIISTVTIFLAISSHFAKYNQKDI